jgi:tetratricopeptide (TPR) repeat protein
LTDCEVGEILDHGNEKEARRAPTAQAALLRQRDSSPAGTAHVSRRGALIPPRDLLRGLDGIGPTLERSRRVGKVGWTAFAFSVVQLLLLTFSSKWWGGVSGGLSGLEWWGLTGAVVVLVASVMLINWTRVWVRESREPFRYTFSIGEFKPLADTEPEPRLGWLCEDLAQRLNQRIDRLALLDSRYSDASEDRESHVHVAGTYGIRDGAIEVFPWVRLGPKSEPANLAHRVRFSVGEDGLVGDDGPALYEKLLEWVYFTVASRIYRQIREDVERKISLLPKRYFRAAAYFYEAKDYQRSNTIDAYDAARELYGEVIRFYDPYWGDPPEAALRRTLTRLGGMLALWSLRWRRWLSAAWPRLGRVELMVARAEIGYASALLDRRALAGLSHQRLNPIFEARPVAEAAVLRLQQLGRDVPGYEEALFDAYVTLASAFTELGSAPQATRRLNKARRLDPARAERDARYLYVRGRAEPQQGAQLFQRAVELDPTFEVAQFHRALAAEALWRRRSTLEPSVALMVIEEYERVLRLNPGNIAAWASQGYIFWLLAGKHLPAKDRKKYLATAERTLQRGRDFKDMRRETFVASLDYALARIAAEEGRWQEAYRSYINAVTSHFAEGVSHSPAAYTAPHFEGMTEAIVQRFDDYRDAVRERRKSLPDDEAALTRRLRDSVYAFVLNDYGEACMNYFLRSGDFRYLERARSVLMEADRELKARYPMISYNLQRLDRWQWRGASLGDTSPSELSDEELLAFDARLDALPSQTDHIERVLAYEPRWPDGMIELARTYTLQANVERELAATLSSAAAVCWQRAKETHEIGGNLAETDRFKKVPDDVLSARRKLLPQAEAAQDSVGFPKRKRVAPADLAVSMARTEDSTLESDEQPERGDELRDAARRMKRKAKELRARAGNRDKKAAEQPKRLLPHEWVWAENDAPDWSLLGRRDLERRRTWERKLDDLHARALYVWCRVRLNRERVGDGGNTEEEGLLQLLEHLRRHFLVGDLEILTDCLDVPGLTERERKMYIKALRPLAADAMIRDPCAVALWYLNPHFFSRERIAEVLETVLAGARGIPPALYYLCGLRLDEIGVPDLADKAYRKALRTDDADLLVRMANDLERRERWEWRGRALRRAFRRDRGSHVLEADVYKREIGSALWRVGKLRHAILWFSAIEGADNSDPGWRTALVRAALDEQGVTSAEMYRLLKRWLGNDHTRAQTRGLGTMRRDAANALLHLTRESYQPLVHRPQDPNPGSGILPPNVLPLIAIEGDSDLFPRDRETPEVARLLDEEIPAMVKAVEQQTGVQIPSPWLLQTPGLGPGRYRLHVDEPRVENGFAPEQRFLVTGSAAEGLDGLPGHDPLSGASGVWIAEQFDGRPGIDRYTFMLRFLHHLVLEHLDALVTSEEVLRLLLESGGGTPDRLRLQTTIHTDERRLARFVHVVRMLAAERVPLFDLDPVVRVFDEAAPDVPPFEIAESARRALGSARRMFDPTTPVAALPPEVEERIELGIHKSNGRRGLVLPTSEADQLRRILHECLDAAPDSLWVVLRAGLRPFVRQIVAQVDPSRDVIGRAELSEVALLGVANRDAGQLRELVRKP